MDGKDGAMEGRYVRSSERSKRGSFRCDNVNGRHFTSLTEGLT